MHRIGIPSATSTPARFLVSTRLLSEIHVAQTTCHLRVPGFYGIHVRRDASHRPSRGMRPPRPRFRSPDMAYEYPKLSPRVAPVLGAQSTEISSNPISKPQAAPSLPVTAHKPPARRLATALSFHLTSSSGAITVDFDSYQYYNCTDVLSVVIIIHIVCRISRTTRCAPLVTDSRALIILRRATMSKSHHDWTSCSARESAGSYHSVSPYTASEYTARCP